MMVPVLILTVLSVAIGLVPNELIDYLWQMIEKVL